MHVGMMLQILPPGVQHSQDADLGAQVPWMGGDLLECASRGAEQQAVHDARVEQRQRRELVWQREYHVEVGYGQKFAAACFQPSGSCGAATLGTMPVATGVVGYFLPAASVTLDRKSVV